MLFCVLFRPLGGSPAAPPGYATAYVMLHIVSALMPLPHFGEFDCELNLFFSFQSRSTFAVSLNAFAVESPTSKNFSTRSKFFQFAAQYPWNRTAVSVGSQCIRHQIDGDCSANPRRLQYDFGECTETALVIKISSITEMT